MSQTSQRSFLLLEHLNILGLATVKQLAERTGLPKATVSRLLKSLKGLGYVDQLVTGEAYRVGEGALALSSGYDRRTAIIKHADAPMRALTARIKWPLALGWRIDDTMLVTNSTIPDSPLAWYRSTLNMSLPIWWSAMGLAYIAHCSPEEFTDINVIEVPAELIWRLGDRDDLLAKVRACGYGFRPPGFEQRTASISVPIKHDGFAIACLSLTYFGMAIREADIVKDHLGALQSAAQSISDEIAYLSF